MAARLAAASVALALALQGAAAAQSSTTPDYAPYVGQSRQPAVSVPSALASSGNYGLSSGSAGTYPAYGQQSAPAISSQTPGQYLAPVQATVPQAPVPQAVPGTGPTQQGTPPSQAGREAPSAAAAPAARAQARQTDERYRKGTVVSGKAEVFDGHSLTVEGLALRLDGADAPGLSQTCKTRSGTEWRCGAAARDRLADLASSGKVTCTLTGPAGEGGAAACSARGLPDLAAVLVSEGLAVPNGHDGGRYSPAMRSAADSRKGMWVGAFTSPTKWRTANAGR